MFAGTLGSQECRNAAICASTETSGNPAHRGVHLRVAHGNEDAVALDQFGEPGVQLPGEDHLKAVEHGVGNGRVADVARVRSRGWPPMPSTASAPSTRVRDFPSRSADAQSSNVISIDARTIHDLRIMVAHRFRTAYDSQLWC